MTEHENKAPRRWRRIVVAGGSLAVLAVAGATAGQAFASQHSGTQPLSVAAGQTAKAADSSTDGSTDGRTVDDSQAALALESAIKAVVTQATFSKPDGFRWQDSGWKSSTSGAIVDVSPDGSGAGQVDAFVGPAANLDSQLLAESKDCQGVDRCTFTTLPSGATLRLAYDGNVGDPSDDVGEGLTAYYTADGMVAKVMVNPRRDDGGHLLDGGRPVLNADQVTSIIEHLKSLG